MPMHDWTLVEPNDYHTFHLMWIASLASTLNNGSLPPGYFALAEHTVRPYVPDVVTLSLPSANGTAAASGGGVAVATAPPPTRFTDTEPGKRKAGRRRVSIQQARDRRVVAVIEIVSPSNKAKRDEFADLVGKSVQLLREGVHLLLIDPFPPTARDPHGLHAVVWKELTGKPFTPPAGKLLTLAAYRAAGDNTYTAYVEPVAPGDRLPDMPVFLTPEVYVNAPLEETYQVAWHGFPPPLRALLA
jgi:hypothetical protein